MLRAREISISLLGETVKLLSYFTLSYLLWHFVFSLDRAVILTRKNDSPKFVVIFGLHVLVKNRM